MELTENQVETLKLRLRRKKIKIEILDNRFKTLYSIEGNAINGSINFNADNPIRRTGNITVAIPTNKESALLSEQLDGFSIKYNGKIWIDKNVRISIGLENNFNSTTWYNMGIYLINQPEIIINANQFELTFDCIDLMAKFTGERQGQLVIGGYSVNVGEYVTNNGVTNFEKTLIKDVLIDILENKGGITQYKIYPIPDIYKYLPYDMSFGIGTTVYDMLDKLISCLPIWQMYFDKNGVFVIEPIFSGKNAPVYPYHRDLYLGQQISYDFENVRNQIVVYGRVNKLSHYTRNTDEEPDNVVYQVNTDTTTSTLILKYASTIDLTKLTVKGTTFGFLSLSTPNTLPITQIEIWSNGTKIISTSENATMSLVKYNNVTDSFGIDYQTTQVEAYSIPQNQICYIDIFSATLNSNNEIDFTNDTIFEFLGKQSVSYCLVNDNKESPFYINGNYKGENYYCGTAQPDINYNLGENYKLVLNDNDSPVSTLSNGTILTFMANSPNIYATGLSYTGISVYSSDGTQIFDNIPLVQNSWYNTTRPYVLENKLSSVYTIWELQLTYVNNSPQFILNGWCKNAYPIVLTGGNYDVISFDELAYQRCTKELYDHSNMQDNTILYMIPDYLIDVNYKIPYYENESHPIGIYDTQKFTTKDNKDFVTIEDRDFYVRYDKVSYFLTKQINFPLGVDATNQTITAIKIYDTDNLTQNE